MGTLQHPGFKKKHTFWAKKKAPAGMGTPQHPGFTHFLGEKKPLREWGHRSTLVLRKNTLFGPKKKPLREWGHRNTLVLR